MRLKMRTWKRCGRLTEFIVSLIEFLWLSAVAALFAWIGTDVDVWTDWDLMTFFTVMSLILSVVQATSTVGSFLDILYLRKKGLRQSYDISIGADDGDIAPGRRIEIFGAPTWAQRYQPESRYVQWARGVSAIICFLSAVCIGFWALFYRPAQTMGASETSTAHSWAKTHKHRPFLAPASILLVFPGSMSPSAENPQLIASLNVSVVSPTSATKSFNGACEPVSTPFYTEAIMAAWCPIAGSQGLWPRSENDTLFSDHRRELLYTVDFPSNFDSSSLHSFYMTNISDIAGQRNALQSMMRATRGTLIWPGATLVALGSFSRWEELSSPVAAALGVHNQLTRRTLYHINSALQDPSPPALQNSQSASIKVIFDVLTRDISVEQAAVENTVLAGFSFVGGVWTFINELFGLVFGCTVGFILFGLKPLSVYGLVHSFTDPKPDLYIRDHDLTPGDKDLVLRTLHQHLLDTGEHHIDTKKQAEAGSVDERETLVAGKEGA
ncbi:hypothetical protein NP233_g6153 [Leucocoprinus birnbaumii]|uniref:Uncharacterized protein n=1 Tax=Leucocoprinus birnbaumii TaxID=56174 RepID=A0AAD5VRI1_9AGAR|nr:hypothetical protein NP233_g6153 [Leucocoprinus birnbaumii]